MRSRKTPPANCCDPQDTKDALALVERLAEFEAQILGIARWQFQSFAFPQSQSWIESFKAAERCFGPPMAGHVTYATLNVVQAMRLARSSTFKFSNPLCLKCARLMTEPERQLTSALAAVRQGERSAAYIHALLLTEGNDPEPLLSRMRVLCDLITPLEPVMQTEVITGEG